MPRKIRTTRASCTYRDARAAVHEYMHERRDRDVFYIREFGYTFVSRLKYSPNTCASRGELRKDMNKIYLRCVCAREYAKYRVTVMLKLASRAISLPDTRHGSIPPRNEYVERLSCLLNVIAKFIRPE